MGSEEGVDLTGQPAPLSQGKRSLLVNGFYGAPVDLKQAPADVVTAAKDTMKDSGYRAPAPVAPAANGHHAQAGQHATSTAIPSTEQAVATASSASHNLPER